jgi:integrase/recombinase XerD
MRPSVWAFRLKGIRRQKRPGGRIIKYHRATGIRLPDLQEGHPDFISAWTMAEARIGDPVAKAQKSVPPGSVASVVNGFLVSQDYQAGSRVYQAILRRHSEAIKAAYPDLPFRAIAAKHIEADLDKLPPNPANERLKTWRKLAKYAKRTGAASAIATTGVGKRKTSVRGHKPWSASDIATFRAKWPIGTVQRACFEFLFWTAARTNDAVRLSPSNIGSDGVLVFTQSKTGGPAHVPWSCRLPEYAEGWESDRKMLHDALKCLSGGFTFLEARGRARSHKGLSNVISDAAVSAGLHRCTAHGLRKARLTAIAECGGSAHAIMAWGGHKTMQEVEEYTRSAAMKLLVTGREQAKNIVSAVNTDTKP